jgi:hypothetical protein
MLNAIKNRMTPNKDQIDEILSSYLDGVLPLDEREALEVRLRQEPALMTRLEHLRQTKKGLANLPNVGVPRNFILSPSMVAPTPRPAAQRQRRTWPAFGWATAAVTVLFLLVFAADIFTPRPEPALPTQIFAQGADHLVEKADTVERAPEAPDVQAAEAEVAVELEMEAKAASAMVTPAEVAEQERDAEGMIEEQPMAEAQVAEPVAEAEAPPTEDAPPLPSGDAREMLTEASSAATAEIEQGRALGAALTPGTPTPEPEGTAAVNDGTTVDEMDTPEADLGLTAKENLPVASPPAVQDEPGSEKPTAIALLMATPETVDATSTTDGRLWLRLTELGLGLAVITLAVITLVLRQRQGRIS